MATTVTTSKSATQVKTSTSGLSGGGTPTIKAGVAMQRPVNYGSSGTWTPVVSLPSAPVPEAAKQIAAISTPPSAQPNPLAQPVAGSTAVAEAKQSISDVKSIRQQLLQSPSSVVTINGIEYRGSEARKKLLEEQFKAGKQLDKAREYERQLRIEQKSVYNVERHPIGVGVGTFITTGFGIPEAATAYVSSIKDNPLAVVTPMTSSRSKLFSTTFKSEFRKSEIESQKTIITGIKKEGVKTTALKTGASAGVEAGVLALPFMKLPALASAGVSAGFTGLGIYGMTQTYKEAAKGDTRSQAMFGLSALTAVAGVYGTKSALKEVTSPSRMTASERAAALKEAERQISSGFDISEIRIRDITPTKVSFETYGKSSGIIKVPERGVFKTSSEVFGGGKTALVGEKPLTQIAAKAETKVFQQRSSEVLGRWESGATIKSDMISLSTSKLLAPNRYSIQTLISQRQFGKPSFGKYQTLSVSSAAKLSSGKDIFISGSRRYISPTETYASVTRTFGKIKPIAGDNILWFQPKFKSVKVGRRLSLGATKIFYPSREVSTGKIFKIPAAKSKFKPYSDEVFGKLRQQPAETKAGEGTVQILIEKPAPTEARVSMSEARRQAISGQRSLEIKTSRRAAEEVIKIAETRPKYIKPYAGVLITKQTTRPEFISMKTPQINLLYPKTEQRVRITPIKITKTDILPKVSERTSMDTSFFSTPPTISTPTPPISSTPFIIPPVIPSFGGVFYGGRRKTSRRARTKYAPSLTARVFGIRGKAPARGKAFTGLEVRPIISTRAPLRRRIKF